MSNGVNDALPADTTIALNSAAATTRFPQNGGAQKEAISGAEIKAYGVTVRIPLPKWAVAAISALLVVGLAIFGGYIASIYIFNKQWIARAKVSEYSESYKHSLESTELKESQPVAFADGTKVTVNHFKSDGCNQIVRWSPATSKADGLWMFGPLLTSDKQSTMGLKSDDPSPTHKTDANSQHVSLLGPGQVLPREPDRRPKLVYVQDSNRSEHYKEVQYGGRCWDPHPGTWSERPQPVNQCAVQVWRYFADGCIHYQWYNPCTGTWDVWPNGAPHVYWQRCIH